VKRQVNFWGILGGDGEVLHISTNTVFVKVTALKINTYSFTYVEHSQNMVLVWQENRCVDSYIVVKCRHHISKVVKTILLEHLQYRTFEHILQMDCKKCNTCANLQRTSQIIMHSVI
jgi:hypothetical protein